MIAIKKQREPISLTRFRSSGGEKFDNLDASTKNDIRNSLLVEQGYLCAYCMRRIGRNRNVSGVYRDVKIEHVIPRSYTELRPELKMKEIDYGNLVAVCCGITNGIKHCDTSKEDNLISIDPCNTALESTISYGLKDGAICSSNKDWNDDLNNKNRLNLNHPSLKVNRISALNGLISVLKKNNKWSDSSLQRILDQLENDTIKNEYLGILRYYLKKRLNRNIRMT